MKGGGKANLLKHSTVESNSKYPINALIIEMVYRRRPGISTVSFVLLNNTNAVPRVLNGEQYVGTRKYDAYLYCGKCQKNGSGEESGPKLWETLQATTPRGWDLPFFFSAGGGGAIFYPGQKKNCFMGEYAKVGLGLTFKFNKKFV